MLRKLLLGLGILVALFVAFVLVLLYWPYAAPPPDRYPEYAALDRPAAEARAAELVARMSLEEKTAQLHGDLEGTIAFWRWGLRTLKNTPVRDLVSSGYNERLGVPALTFTDGPRGVAFARGSTAFPVAMARAATWDVELERAVAGAIATECRRGGYNYIANPCINLLRHPGWGRAQECYGEDPLLTERMGVAHVDGLQRHGVMACPKHYAANSLENNRFNVDVALDERTLHEVYLPHFKATVDSGAASIMSAYNKVNGEYAGQNRRLLEGILRDEWGFRGFVTSDWFLGVYDAEAGVHAGMDIEMPWDKYYGAIPDLVAAGAIDEARVDTLARRVVAGKLYWTSRAGVPGVDYAQGGRLSGDDHKALARRAATEAMVLLKNDGGVLPLDGGALRRVLVVGELATAANLGDEASSSVAPESYVTILEGLRAALGEGGVVDHLADPDAAELSGAIADGDYDAVVAVVGYAGDDEGENIELFRQRDGSEPTWGTGGDRNDLRLKRPDVARLHALAGAHPRTVALVIGGSAIAMDEWIGDVPAVVMAWYPGERGGEAVAEVLLGEAEPGGRLPVSLPREGQTLPRFDPFADTVRYGQLHGYTYHQATAQAPLFAFGYGLGYGTVTVDTAYLDTTAVAEGGGATVTVVASNTGARETAFVPQVYVSWPAAAERPDGVLTAFAKTRIAPGASATVELPVDTRRWRNYAGDGRWRGTPGAYRLYVGTDAGEARARVLEVVVE